MNVFQIVVYLVIALAVSLMCEAIFGRRARGGLPVTMVLACGGAWLTVQLLRFTITGEPVVEGVPLLSGTIGALVVATLWSILLYPRSRRYR